MKKSALLCAVVLLAVTQAHAAPPTHIGTPAQTVEADVFTITANGIGNRIGKLYMQDSPDGLLITPDIAYLPPGDHGFHLHEHADCRPGEKDGKVQAGIAAGGHFDPEHTGHHMGPTGEGHKGDLPVLTVAADGTAHQPVIAPHLKLADVSGHAFIIHEGGDNFSDDPKPLGGGAGRIACAAVQ